MNRHALLIGTRDYQGFDSLPAVDADLHYLHQVLEDPEIGGFEVAVEHNHTADRLRMVIGDFLDARKPEDLVLLYLSGHGAWSADAGQLYFAGCDTFLDRLPETGVDAEYVNNVLEECRAHGKVLLLDCCDSGGYAQGLRVRGAADQQQPRRKMADMLRGHGVYVLTASDQGQHAWEDGTGSQDLKPALFTDAVVEGLRTGKADVTGQGFITPDYLFTYVSEQVRISSARIGRHQSPTKSAVGVVGTEIELARSVAGRTRELRPLTTTSVDGQAGLGTPAGQPAAAVVDGSAVSLNADGWRRLLGYYRDCLGQEAADKELLDIQKDRQMFALWPGADEILVGETVSVRVPQGSDVEELVKRVLAEGKTLTYGYPAVLLFGRERRSTAKLAPLFARVVEPVKGDEGWVLQSVGQVLLHPALIREKLNKDDADALLATPFEPSWSAGNRNQLAREAKTQLEKLGLTATEPLRPAALSASLNDQLPKSGARNVALLYEASESAQTTKGLVEGLGKLRERSSGFAGTALAALADSDSSGEVSGATDFHVVAPFALNEAQEVVLRSAMTRRLTVATGPPGTGKSQLVANLVATAVANDQSVLVTSTNNRAVDEVWERCQSITPGLIVRTGSRFGERNYEQAEIDCLRRILAVAAPTTPPDVHPLRLRAQDLNAAREQCARKADTETELFELGRRRAALAAKLGFDLARLPAVLHADTALDSWQRRVRKVARAWLLGGWRRRRLADRLDLADAAPDTCATVADFLDVEAKWRLARATASHLPSDATLLDKLRRSQQTMQEAARVLVRSVVAERLSRGQGAVKWRLKALLTNDSKWSAFNKARKYLRGWAITTHSAHLLPPDSGVDQGGFDLVIVDEATQCSIPAVLAMLYRAKRALIIGDPMQLTHIATATPAQNGACRRAAGLGAALLEKHQLDYIRHSAFHAAAAAFGEPLLLDEHYRCHPEIVTVSNRLCYADQLIILTDLKRLKRIDKQPALQWVDIIGTPLRPNSGSWYNQAEIDEVVKVVNRLLRVLPNDATIGVVTPFAAQKDRIEKRISGPRVRVGTAHAFQGGERDAMVLSLVSGPQMFSYSLAWLERSPNLWNVAITRARAHLVVVGNRSFWQGRAGIVGALEETEARDGSVGRLLLATEDPAGDALHRLLERLSVPMQRDALRDGYTCDFLLDLAEQQIGVVLDRGSEQMAPDRHLRLQLDRCDRLRSTGLSAVERIPAWQVHEDPDGVIHTLFPHHT